MVCTRAQEKLARRGRRDERAVIIATARATAKAMAQMALAQAQAQATVAKTTSLKTTSPEATDAMEINSDIDPNEQLDREAREAQEAQQQQQKTPNALQHIQTALEAITKAQAIQPFYEDLISQLKEAIKLEQQEQPRAPSYSFIAKKGLENSQWAEQTPKRTIAAKEPTAAKEPIAAKTAPQNPRKTDLQVVLKLETGYSFQKPLPSITLRNKLNQALGAKSIASVQQSARNNIVITATSAQLASNLLTQQDLLEKTFQDYPIKLAEAPTKWIKLVAHGVPILEELDILSIFQEETETFNPIKTIGQPRWLKTPSEEQKAGSVVFAVPTEAYSFNHDSGSCRKAYKCAICAGSHNTKNHSCPSCKASSSCQHQEPKCHLMLESYLKIFQHNTHRTDTVHHTALQLALEAKADIIMLQEPYCSRNKETGNWIALEHTAYNLITPQPGSSPSSIKSRPRVLSYVRKASQLEFTPRYDLFNDPDILAIEILGIEPFLLINLYNEQPQQASQQANQQGLHTIERSLFPIGRLKQPSILAGDFNLHHTRWNTQAKPTARANSLVQWLDSQQATLLVDTSKAIKLGGTYHRENLRRPSVIDLAFSIGFQALSWGNWQAAPATGSDHEALTFEAYVSRPLGTSRLYQTRQPLFNYKKADWKAYSKLLTRAEPRALAQIDQLIGTSSWDEIANLLRDTILEAAELAIARQRPSERSKPWWNDELKDLRKALNRATRLYKAGPTAITLAIWKEARNSYNLALRAIKRAHWNSFLEEAVTTDIYKAYKYTKARQNSSLPSITYTKEDQQQQAQTFEEKCIAFLQTLFPTPAVSHAESARRSKIEVQIPSRPRSKSADWLDLRSTAKALQNLALARILGAFKRSPYKALELEAAIPPVEVRLQKACLKYGLRTQTLSETHPIRLAITSTAAPTQLTRLLASLDKAIGKYERIERQDLVWQAPWNKEPKATILISQASKKEAKKQHLQLLEDLTFDNYRAFYTDGSQGTHKGTSTNSCAYYEDSPSRQTEAAKTARVARFWNLGPYIEVADAELIAISKVLDALLLSRTNQPTAYIFVDSQAAIMKIKGPGEISYRIRAQLHLLSQQSIAITVAWVPSHTGIPGNEIADQLAKKGLEASYRGRPYASLSYLNRKIRKVIVQQWQTSWASEEMREETGQRARGLGTQYRRIAQDNLSFSLKANLVKGPRSTQSAYIQLKLGIGYLKSYQKAIKNLPDDRCRCSQRHTTQHLLLRCSRYQGPRKALQKALGPGAQLTLQKLFTTKLGKEALIGFLTSTKICTRSWFLEE
ncbi:hypothetical protein PT974_10874 [Cladobotryum mycophilum]|uniref:RNase H type-1 domain-containing protein n=2 Tax=Cladobotryum mycophilum TaxID=491253 RepID=A0ABR0SBY9_9HYPO